jgi:hypothetical protein
MDFLPEDYEAPKTSGYYMKLQDGENRLRILSRPVLGWEDWKDKKPVRFKMNEKPETPFDPEKPIKHFWAMVVWNYNDSQIQILQINQAGIRKAIENLSKDGDWGAPYGYDIKIVRKGEKINTEYSVNPVPHKTLDSSIEKMFRDRPINLQALFMNADPFDKSGNAEEFMPTSEKRETQIVEVKRSKLSIAQFNALNKKLDLVPDYKERVRAYLETKDITDFFDIPLSMLQGILDGADKELGKENEAMSA